MNVAFAEFFIFDGAAKLLMTLYVGLVLSAGCSRTASPSGAPAQKGDISLLPFTSPNAARRRTLTDFELRPSLSLNELTREMGPPNDEIGSGTTWFVYKLDDGRQLHFHFLEPFDRLDVVDLVEIRDGMEVSRVRVFDAAKESTGAK
jgi:hypothetical protein